MYSVVQWSVVHWSQKRPTSVSYNSGAMTCRNI